MDVLTFSEALVALCEGESIRRIDWPEGHWWQVYNKAGAFTHDSEIVTAEDFDREFKEAAEWEVA